MSYKEDKMTALQNIFENSITQNLDSQNLDLVIKDLVLELAHKKLFRLKDTKQIQKRVSQLYEIFSHTLQSIDIESERNTLAIVDGLMSAVSFDKEAKLYEKIYEKERLEYEIESDAKQIQEDLRVSFEALELTCSDEKCKKVLKIAKLRGVQMLGILQDVVQEALLTAIEKGGDIQDTTNEMIKYFVFQSINTGEFTKKRFLQIVKSVLDVSVDISNTDQAHAKEIIRGSVFGAREGISKAINVFKNDLSFSPKYELLHEDELKNLKKELLCIDDAFIELLKNYAKEDSFASGKIIDEMLTKELDNAIARMRRTSNDAKETINERIEELRESASEKFEQLKQNAGEFEKIATQKVEELKESAKSIQAKEEAKKLGEKAWELAKDFAKNAKEAMSKR